MNTANRPRVVARTHRTWELLKTLTPRGFRIRYRESKFDLAWAIITPLVILAVYGVILTQAFEASAECAGYLSSAWIGLIIWTFFASALTVASTSILSASDLCTKVYFPRESLPLADVGVTLIDLAIGMVTVVAVSAVQGIQITPALIVIIPALIIAIAWTAAVCVIAAVVTVFIRDVVHVVQLAIRAGFFATPVMYEPSFLPENLLWLTVVNPLAVSIDAIRQALLCGTWPDPVPLAIHMVLGVALLVASVWYVRDVESRMVDIL